MLNKQFRLNLRVQSDFFLHSKKIHTPYFSLFYQNSESFQATVVVSKKTANLATKRNALKRKFRSALQNLLTVFSQMKIKLVIVVYEKSVNMSVDEIAQHIEKNVQKIRI